MTEQHDAAPSSRARSTRSELPEDRFDRLPRARRVGAHRMVARPRRFWVYLVSALVGLTLLTGAGIVVVHSLGGAGDFLDRGADERPVVEQVKPELDPEAAIAVLNGTTTPGLEVSVGQIITDNGWGQIAFTEVAASNEVQISAVFYTSVADEASALALANELGGVSIYQSYDYTQYGVQLVVLLGADYAGPGLPEASAE